jgi:hypothetical protein
MALTPFFRFRHVTHPFDLPATPTMATLAYQLRGGRLRSAQWPYCGGNAGHYISELQFYRLFVDWCAFLLTSRNAASGDPCAWLTTPRQLWRPSTSFVRPPPMRLAYNTPTAILLTLISSTIRPMHLAYTPRTILLPTSRIGHLYTRPSYIIRLKRQLVRLREA